MVLLVLGCAALLVLMGALGAFSRAQVATAKALGLWVVAIGGLLLAVMLLLTGRGVVAVAALTFLGPLVWSWLGEARRPAATRAGAGGGAGGMSRAEALEVLGLAPGATRAAIQEAHKRLMRAAHPDGGGSNWLAARINQARDVLLS